jgi:hypothetical protein
MDDDDLTQRYAAEFGPGVGVMIRAVQREAVRTEAEYAEVPYIKDRFPAHRPYVTPQLERMICRALAAREWFRQHAPPGMPELPLSSAEIRKLIWSGNNRRVVVGLFANSLACANWAFEIHPVFRDYVCGVMASPDTSEHIRADPELLKEFPPKPLEGLDSMLCWGFFDRIAEFLHQLMRNEECLRRRGDLRTADWTRQLIRDISVLSDTYPISLKPI